MFYYNSICTHWFDFNVLQTYAHWMVT